MKNSESFHWYTSTGEEMHRIVGANGKERNTNLRDARKLNLLPSVTTVMGIMDKPGLNIWKVNQAIMSALTCPILPDETESEWLHRVKTQDATEAVTEAANEGTRIHGILESYFTKGLVTDIDTDDDLYVVATLDVMKELGKQTWLPEKACVSDLGFAGKVDLHSKDYIVDFKTKDGSLEKVKCWPEHYRQLAAYRHALNLPKAECLNIFISRDTLIDGLPEVKIIKHTPEQSSQGWKEFLAILNVWQVMKKYYPQLEELAA